MTAGVFSRMDILDLLAVVADRLAEEGTGSQVVLVVVGGSFMALQGLRSTTADIDTLTQLDDRVRRVVEVVAAERDLRPDWINDRSAGFAPIGLELAVCSVLFERPSLRVLGPPPDVVFLVMLFAARGVDFDDLIALWPASAFTSPQDAVERFHAAYPYLERDPHLGDYVAGIAAAAG